jgi:hypothetical protein
LQNAQHVGPPWWRYLLLVTIRTPPAEENKSAFGNDSLQ